MPKSYKLTHGRFTLEYAKIGGYCSFPDRLAPGPDLYEIVIDSRAKGREKLEHLIHEFTHAEFPTMSEEDVSRFAEVMGKVLWSEGYREKAP